MKSLTTLSVLLSLILLSPAYAEQTGQPLTMEEILTLVKGNTAEAIKTRDVISSAYETTDIRFQTYYRADGVVIQRGAGGGEKHGTTAEGTWWLKKNKLCYQFPHALMDTGKKCRKVVPIGNGAYELKTGKGETTHTWERIIEGNPHGLK